MQWVSLTLTGILFHYMINNVVAIEIDVKDRRRIINVDSIADVLGEKCYSLACSPFFTGNDYTSGFRRIGKTKAFNNCVNQRSTNQPSENLEINLPLMLLSSTPFSLSYVRYMV